MNVKRVLIIVIALVLLALCAVPWAARSEVSDSADSSPASRDSRTPSAGTDLDSRMTPSTPQTVDAPAAMPVTVDTGLEEVLVAAAPGEIISTLIFLSEQADIASLQAELEAERAPFAVRNEEVLRTLHHTSDMTQAVMTARLTQMLGEGLIESFEPFWLINGYRVDAPAEVILELATDRQIQRVYFNPTVKTIEPIDEGDEHDPRDEFAQFSASVEPGVAAVRAPDAWALGFTGSGVLVSSLDTGVAGNHPAVGSRWRGHDSAYTGNPQWAWFDPVTNTTSPQEFASGSHGTHTMGTILGGSPGDFIGVAPGAQWIHAAVIDRVDIPTTVADVIAAFQWVVDPDGNPSTSWDVPRVCSNSWGVRTSHGYPPCDDLFWSFIDNAEAAGVLMLFAAGNEGTTEMRRPADRATDAYRSVAVAAVDAHNSNWPVASFSSRGPTYCTPDGSAAIKPDIAGPGVSVRSAVSGGYGSKSGTSMSTPHVAGVVALIFDACPALSVSEVKQILYDTAFDLGTAGKNNQTGWGMVDALEAVLLAHESCSFHIDLPGGAPAMIEPGVPTVFDVTIIEGNEPVVPGSAMLMYRFGTEPFAAVPLTHLGGQHYEAILPAAACGSDPMFYLVAEGVEGTVRTNPPNAPQHVHAPKVGSIQFAATIDHSFDAGLPDGWTMTGLWNVTNVCVAEGECPNEYWAYYGNPSTCRYETGFSRNFGSMTSTPILVPQPQDSSGVTLSFCYNLITEPNFAYDKAIFRINGQNIKQFHDSHEWTTFTHDMTGYAGQYVTLEWHFDTVDGLTNYFRGWQVDQIRIAAKQFVCEDPSGIPGDLNGDGVVNVADMLLMFDQWGPCADCSPSQCPADLNGDCSVGISDLLILFDNWG
jgi:subtilisin family serine protease